MNKIRFTDKYGSFQCENADSVNGLYFPLAGEKGLKSAFTPKLGGDAKTDQNHFLMEPVSIENLHNNRSTRNFWIVTKDNLPWSVSGASLHQAAGQFTDKKETTSLEAGFMWQRISRTSFSTALSATVTSFVPYWCNCEVMQVAVKNAGDKALTFTPVAAIPIYGRSADNIRDHRHVTSLLSRITVRGKGIVVNPTLSFDERGHQVNDTLYYVLGQEADGKAPVAFYPDVEGFIGERGNLECPESLIPEIKNTVPAGTVVNGQEALGGLVFETVTLEPGETKEYTVFAGICSKEREWKEILNELADSEAVRLAFEKNKKYWQEKINVSVETGDENHDMFLKWVCFQPELRRIYGCSFLPHHDYGKGGRGWRDLWQDCLALLLMNPESVRELLLSNFGGVRIDGSNATIIGEKQGEFKADRNSITRVWMDHGVWPFITTLLYLNQTGDTAFLYETMPYFKDRQVLRGKAVDEKWDGNTFTIYQGTVLEHLLLQNLCAFWEVGEHNHILLRDADWNDALDMANERGESVAFSNAYGKNLLDLADLLRKEAEKGVKTVSLLEEIALLLKEENLYDDAEGKRMALKTYMEKCKHTVSGNQMQVDTLELAANLERKGQWMLNHIRRTEWVTDGKGNGWYNGYYDNSGNRVEGASATQVRMMLTGQVFSIMGGTASKEQIKAIVKSADTYLYDEDCGGYRLNTDFQEVKTDMGRMFGFAYGEKENGAVFSHMAVMFANALYQRGFAKEGHKALHSLYRQSMNVEKSRIFPGIPEYFGAGGRGLYHYLTGAASWYMLTVITQMFGVRGEEGQLVLEPKLLASQFTKADVPTCSIDLTLMNKKWHIEYANPDNADFGEYEIAKVTLDGQEIANEVTAAPNTKFKISKDIVGNLDAAKTHHLTITLSRRK